MNSNYPTDENTKAARGPAEPGDSFSLAYGQTNDFAKVLEGYRR
jgi:hypothetical protein